jgi:hypothetical protein
LLGSLDDWERRTRICDVACHKRTFGGRIRKPQVAHEEAETRPTGRARILPPRHR